MRKRIIVLTNGPIEDLAIICSRLEKIGEVDVIAANGGSLHAKELGLPLHAVLGDLDSLSTEMQETLAVQDIQIQRSPSEKDETDLELALLYAAKQGVEEIIILGAFGGRIDMSMANLLLLTHPQLSDVHIEIWNGTQTAWIIRPPGDEVHGHVGDTLSMIPLMGEAKGVTTQNLAYPLIDETIPIGPSRGISNVLTNSTACIMLQEGLLLAVHTPGRA